MAQARARVVRTGVPLPDAGPETELLDAAGADFVQRPTNTEDELIELVRDADIIINSGTHQTKRVIDSLTRCKAIIQQSVGYDVIDVDAATARGIMVGNLHDYCIEEVSDHAMALILACARRLPLQQKVTRDGSWVRGRGYATAGIGRIQRLGETTLGIVGFGNIGKLVAQKASGFRWRILAADPFVSAEVVAQHGATLVPLDELLREADFVTLHVFLNEQTRHLIDARALSLMKPTAYVINTCRGPIVDEPALIGALRDGRLAGAGLDVFETEPLPLESPLLEMDNVIATPHTAVISETAMREWRAKPFQEAMRILNGHFPRGLVNRQLKTSLPYTDDPA